MRVEEILALDAEQKATETAMPPGGTGTYVAKRNEAHPEIAELLNARTANMLFNCRLLARDEIELANFIINKLDVNPHYVPSDTLLQAIRTICAKLSGQAAFAGMLRTA